MHLLEDENIPVERNIFDSSPAHELMEELTHMANSIVAAKLFTALPEKALLRRQSPPNFRRLQTFVDRMNRLGFDIDSSSSGTLQSSLFKIQDADIRKVGSLLTSRISLLTITRAWKRSLSSPCAVPSTIFRPL